MTKLGHCARCGKWDELVPPYDTSYIKAECQEFECISCIERQLEQQHEDRHSAGGGDNYLRESMAKAREVKA